MMYGGNAGTETPYSGSFENSPNDRASVSALLHSAVAPYWRKLLVEEMDSVKTCEGIKALPNPPYILVHSAYELTGDVCSCLLAGADGYLHKSTSCEEFVEAVKKVGRGQRVWHEIEKIEERKDCLQKATSMTEVLTTREREVLALMLGRQSGSEIARKLCVGTETIKTHTRRIFRKLGINSRSELFGAD